MPDGMAQPSRSLFLSKDEANLPRPEQPAAAALLRRRSPVARRP